MNLETFTAKLTAAAPRRIRSITLYGSAAAGNSVEKRSSYNLLLVLDRLGVEELRTMSEPIRQWLALGQPLPIPFTLEQLKTSADVFPLEMLDMKDNRRVLHGEDVLAAIEVSMANLRHQLEYELKSKRLQLEGRYIIAAGDRKAVLFLLTDTLSAFLVLARGALRLFQPVVPASKLEALRLLGQRLDIPVDVFEMIHDLKAGQQPADNVDAEPLFGRYLEQLNGLINAIDRFLHPGKDKT